MPEHFDASLSDEPQVQFFIRCPRCGKRFRGYEECLGKTARCKLCNRKFVVQRRRETSSRETARVAVACTHCGAKRRIAKSHLDKEIVCDRCGLEYVARRTADSKGAERLPVRSDDAQFSIADLAGKEPADGLDPSAIDRELLERIDEDSTGQIPPGLVGVFAALPR